MKFKSFQIQGSVQMVDCQNIFLRNSTRPHRQTPLRISSLRSKKDTAVTSTRPVYRSPSNRRLFGRSRSGQAAPVCRNAALFFLKFKTPPPGRNADKPQHWIDADGDVCAPVIGLALAFIVLTIIAGGAVWIGLLLAVISKVF